MLLFQKKNSSAFARPRHRHHLRRSQTSDIVASLALMSTQNKQHRKHLILDCQAFVDSEDGGSSGNGTLGCTSLPERGSFSDRGSQGGGGGGGNQEVSKVRVGVHVASMLHIRAQKAKRNLRALGVLSDKLHQNMPEEDYNSLRGALFGWAANEAKLRAIFDAWR